MAGQKVVILLATLNGGAFLREQLASYAAQTHQDWELVVSDDGSVDDTMEIVRSFAQTIPQPVTILQGPAQGHCQNFLSMIRRHSAEGDYFAFSDQDDVWMKEKLARAIAWLQSVPAGRPALYFSRTMLISEDGQFLGFSPLFSRPPVFRNALVQNIGGGNTMVLNKAAHQVLAGAAQAQPVSHDWWSYQVITGVGGLAHYDSWPSLKYRQHGQNLIGSNAGWRAGLRRLRGFLGHRFSNWNETNLAALRAVNTPLAMENRLAFETFAKARQASSPRRLYLLWRSGVYRQNLIETVALYWGALLNRI